MASQKPYRRKLSWQSKQIVYNLHNYLSLRKRDPNSKEHQDDININYLVAEATSLSIATICKIVKEGNTLKHVDGKALFATTEKQTKKITKKRIHMDCFIEGHIRRRILQAALENNNPLTYKIAHNIIIDEDIVKTSREYIRKLLIKLGFLQTKKKNMLYENPATVSHRWSFLNYMKKIREEEKNIIYLDETYFGLTEGNLSNWETDDEKLGVLFYNGNVDGLIVLTAGGRHGFLDGVLSTIKTLQIRDFDINYVVFSKWFKEQLVPKFPRACTVIMDNAEYHMSTENPDELDKLLSDNGHKLLRLPPYHQELNLMELIWRDLKQGPYLKSTSFCDFDEMHTALEEISRNYPQEKWDDCMNYMEKVESEYLQYNDVFDNIIGNTAKGAYNAGSQKTSCFIEDDDESC